MKVRAYKNIDIDVEVDVDIHDVMNELSETVQEADIGRVYIQAVDRLTRILALIPDRAIDYCKATQREIVAARLECELKRWKDATGKDSHDHRATSEAAIPDAP